MAEDVIQIKSGITINKCSCEFKNLEKKMMPAKMIKFGILLYVVAK